MQGSQHPAKRQLLDARERTIDGLSIAFTRDELSIEEFEGRVDRAFAARTVQELAGLVGDLGAESQAAASAEVAPGQAPAMVRVEAAPLATVSSTKALGAVDPHATRPPKMITVFGNIERSSLGNYPARSQIVCVFGNVELDLREAILSASVTEIEVRAVFGNIEITIPPHVAVVCEGTGVFGSFAGVNRVPVGGATGERLLRITGTAVFGNVELHTLPVSARTQRDRLLPGRQG